MTPTPRTDAIAHRGYNESAYIAEMTDLARELERELAELTEDVGKCHDAIGEDRASDTSELWKFFETHKQVIHRLQSREDELDKWETELSKVMPPDFKDWWHNSKTEWPLVARLVIEGKNRNAEFDSAAYKNLEIEIADAVSVRDSLSKAADKLEMDREYNARLCESLSAELATERALADRLADELAGIAWLQSAIVPNPAELAVAAWKEARRG